MKFLHEYFPQIYCINLDYRTDRWSECQEEFAKHNLIVKRFSAFDGKNLEKIEGLSPGKVGAIYSHREVIKFAKDNQFENILILEDDVEFDDNLNKMFFEFINEIPKNWDMIFFGANHSKNNIWMKEPLIEVSNHVYKIIRSYANHCYVVRHAAYDRLIEVLSKKDKPSDVLISDIQGELNCYLFRPHLAWQRASYSDIEEEFVDYTFLKK